MEKLEWIPLYIDKLLSSPAWIDMEDYQRGWYIQLLLRCSRSDRLGYLKMESNLWTIAGAKRRDFFESHKSAVLACFKVCEIDGHQWLYNERLLKVMGTQNTKLKRVRASYSEVDVVLGSKFVKPTLEEIREYVHTRGDLISPEAFYDFYESVGWKIGKKPMKKWHNAVGTWERRIEGKSNGSKRQQEFEDAIRRAEENAESDAGFPKFQT